MKCPKCSAETEYIPGESVFCMECGTDLSADISAEADTHAPAENARQDDLQDRDVFANIVSSVFAKSSSPAASAENDSTVPTNIPSRIISGDASGAASSAIIIQHKSEVPDMDDLPVAPQFPAAGGTAAAGDCPCLEVKYNRRIFFLRGSSSVIKLNLIPQVSGLKNILIFMETVIDGKKISTRGEFSYSVLQRFKSYPVQIPFSPDKISGSISLSFYIGCNTGNEFKYYEFHVDHPVYDPALSSAKIANQVNMEITATGAADVTVKDALSNICKGDPTAHELIYQLNQLVPDFIRQELFQTSWRPENISNSCIADKLMLIWKDMRILICSKREIVFGRDTTKVDFPVRGSDKEENKTVSRIHGVVAYAGDTVRFTNRSGNGTWINDRKVDAGDIQLPDNSLVEFGDIKWRMNIQRCHRRGSENICQSCCAGKARAVSVKRHDTARECYLLIWQCCDLGIVIPELAGWDIFTREGAFVIRTPDGVLSNLRPGVPVKCQGTAIDVKHFPVWKAV